MTDSTKYTHKLASSRILILGGTSGIGYSVAEATLEAGATVILSSSNPSRVESAIASLLKTYPSAKSRLSGHACNLGDASSLEGNIAALFAICGELNHVIFTAGDHIVRKALDEIDLESVQNAGLVRFFAPLFVAKYAARVLPKSPASSLTLTTGAVSERPHPGWGVLNSYATGLHGMTRGLALDMGPVRVNCISPGPVETPLWAGLSKEMFEGIKKNYVEKSTTKVFGQPEDTAEAYVYVLRDQNCTGSVISTNSGSLLV